MRSLKNKKQLEQVTSFFETYTIFPHMLEEHIDLYEPINRIFFYKESTAQERADSIIAHFTALPQYFTTAAIHKMYVKDDETGVLIWKSEDLGLESHLWYHCGQRKEGLLSLFLTYEGEGVYHINFRLGKGFNGEPCIWVGTIQGYKEGLNKAKKITKKMYGYRPKNFMFFLLRQLAANMNIHSLYAVSDEGFYTNTHLIRGNRHKLVKFDDFWAEIGGVVCKEDSRFFRIPLEEVRKTYETAKTHKRNMYRNRYALLDGYIEEIKNHSDSYLVSF